MRDEYNRVIWPDSRTLPTDAEAFTIWRGLIVHPGRIVINSQRDHLANVCRVSNGWMASGAWWFRCAVCGADPPLPVDGGAEE